MHSIDLLTSLHYCFAFIWQSQDIVRFLRIKTWSCIQRISIGTNYRHWFLWLCFNQFGKSGSALNTHNQLSKGRVIWNHIFVLVSSPKINCIRILCVKFWVWFFESVENKRYSFKIKFTYTIFMQTKCLHFLNSCNSLGFYWREIQIRWIICQLRTYQKSLLHSWKNLSC